MIVQGQTTSIIYQNIEDTKVSLRILIDYVPMHDIMIARFDILTYKDGQPYKQFNCSIELNGGPGTLPKPHGIEGFTTLVSKETLKQIFKSFLEKLEEN